LLFSQHGHESTGFLPRSCLKRLFEKDWALRRGRIGMLNRLPSLSRVFTKSLEVIGAGLTSALVAFLLGRTATPTPPPPLPAVVHLAPADEEIMRSVRSDQAALLDQMRSDSQARSTQVASVAQLPAPAVALPASAAPLSAVSASTLPVDVPPKSVAAKPAKSAPTVAHRDHKPERVRVADAKPRIEPRSEPRIESRIEPAAEQPLPIQPTMATPANPSAGAPEQRTYIVTPGVAPAPESDTHLTSTFKTITAWILPSRDRAPENVPPNSVPRPPKPVGEFLQSDM
jgi:hypothetical protein